MPTPIARAQSRLGGRRRRPLHQDGSAAELFPVWALAPLGVSPGVADTSGCPIEDLRVHFAAGEEPGSKCHRPGSGSRARAHSRARRGSARDPPQATSRRENARLPFHGRCRDRPRRFPILSLSRCRSADSRAAGMNAQERQLAIAVFEIGEFLRIEFGPHVGNFLVKIRLEFGARVQQPCRARNAERPAAQNPDPSSANSRSLPPTRHRLSRFRPGHPDRCRRR